jgi:hypothetical protein
MDEDLNDSVDKMYDENYLNEWFTKLPLKVKQEIYFCKFCHDN